MFCSEAQSRIKDVRVVLTKTDLTLVKQSTTETDKLSVTDKKNKGSHTDSSKVAKPEKCQGMCMVKCKVLSDF